MKLTEEQKTWCSSDRTPIDPNHDIHCGFTDQPREGSFLLFILSRTAVFLSQARLLDIMTNRQHPAIVAWYEYDNLSDAKEMLCHFVRHDKAA